MNANGYTTRLLHLLRVLTCLRKVHDTNKSAVNKEYEFSKSKTKIVCEENHTKNCMCCALDLNQHLERQKNARENRTEMKRKQKDTVKLVDLAMRAALTIIFGSVATILGACVVYRIVWLCQSLCLFHRA